MKSRPALHLFPALLVCLGLLGTTDLYATDSAAPQVHPDSSVSTAEFNVPYSAYASPIARETFQHMVASSREAPPINAPIETSRAYYERINADRVARMRKLYPVHVHAEQIGGIGTDVVEPTQGIASTNQKRVLINLHGGAFLWGAHSGGLVESIPIASLGRIKVISVDYRQGPEHVFPAASEDVEAVYRALLKQYKPAEIGIYGCSAGGILTGEVVARLITHKLPTPGAIGTFCGSLVNMEGDSAYIAPLLNGQAVPANPLMLDALPYFKGANPADPQVFPGNSSALLAKFPPTLLISGTRDFAMSSVLRSQALLSQAGVDTELHVWDGMWHSFFSDPELPESQQAYTVIVKFFERRLAR
ncbi:MAG: alpha/beta hydrolase fold domain-containing protein [Rhodanobacter sp.]